MRTLIVILSFTCLCLIACKKDLDEISPSITIVKPTQGKVFHVYDTLFIKAEVSDDRMLKWIKFDIIRSNNSVAVSGPERQLNDATSEVVLEQIVLDDVHLESGNYHLRARAFDGENEKFEFVEITLIEAPKERLRLLCISTPGPSSVQLDSISIDGSLHPIAALSSDFSGASVNPWHREITLFGRANGSINSFESEDLVANGSTSITSGLDPLYHHVRFSPERLRHVISRADGQVELYGPNTNLSFSFPTQAGFRPHHVVADNAFIYCEERSLSGDLVSINSYYASSGSLHASLMIPEPVVELITYEDGVLIFSGGDGGNSLSFYDPSNVVVSELSSLRQDLGELIAVVRYTPIGVDDFFVLLYEDGTDAIRVTNISQLFPNYQWMIQANELDVDEVSGQLLIREANALNFFLPGNTNPVSMVNLPSGTQEIHLFYNK